MNCFDLRMLLLGQGRMTRVVAYTPDGVRHRIKAGQPVKDVTNGETIFVLELERAD